MLNRWADKAILDSSEVRIGDQIMKRLALAALVAVAAAAAPLPSMAYSNVSLFINTAPPAPLYERVPPPRLQPV